MTTKHPVQEAFGKAMRRARLAAGISQEELGERAELHRTYIGDIERGERNVSLLNLHRLAQALNLKLSVLIRQMEDVSAKRSGSRKSPNAGHAGKPERVAEHERGSRSS